MIYSPDVFCFKIQVASVVSSTTTEFESVGDIQKVVGTPCTIS